MRGEFSDSGASCGRPVVLAAAFLAGLVAAGPVAEGRQWSFPGVAQPVEAEYVGMQNGAVVLTGPNGKSFELPFANFSPADQKYLKLLEAGGGKLPPEELSGKPITTATGYAVRSVETLTGQTVEVKGATELHVTGTGDPVTGSSFNFKAADGWLFFDRIPASVVEEKFVSRMLVDGRKAVEGKNLRVASWGGGAVVIPQGKDFPGMTAYEGKDLTGAALPLEAHEVYKGGKLGKLKGGMSSFILKRGYMATIAEKEDGTGASRNYVAQDHDVVVKALPPELERNVRFARVFPWRWTGKKGVAGAIWQNLNVGWFYDWNISTKSSADIEYVPIKQKKDWPGLDQDWRERGSLHLLGYNEPDRPDQAKMTVDEAIAGWPRLMGTGLRLGSPAVSDGGLNWLYQFMDKADAAKLRVDFVAVHYYRAVSDPGDGKAAAEQLFNFVKGVHERTKRPVWVTEWNNGANWTGGRDPDAAEQREAIGEMIKMLDKAPFVERYALYNWVEECRELQRKDGSLTPAGEVYREKVSPVGYQQEGK